MVRVTISPWDQEGYENRAIPVPNGVGLRVDARGDGGSLFVVDDKDEVVACFSSWLYAVVEP